jgi:hypothetical protein
MSHLFQQWPRPCERRGVFYSTTRRSPIRRVLVYRRTAFRRSESHAGER